MADQLDLDLEPDERMAAIRAEHAANPYRYRLEPAQAFRLRALVQLSPGRVRFVAQEMGRE